MRRRDIQQGRGAEQIYRQHSRQKAPKITLNGKRVGYASLGHVLDLPLMPVPEFRSFALSQTCSAGGLRQNADIPASAAAAPRGPSW